MKTYEKQTTTTDSFIKKDDENGRDDTVVFVRNSNFSIDTYRPNANSLAFSPRLGSHESNTNQQTSVKVFKSTNYTPIDSEEESPTKRAPSSLK